MRRVIISFLILTTLSVIVGVGYIATKYKSTSSMMTEASALINSGDEMLAKDILLKVIVKDPSNEEAIVMLANISEKSESADITSERWQQAYDLNPLNSNYYNKMFMSLINAHYDSLTLIKYQEFENSPEMTDEIRFHTAMACLRLGRLEKLAQINAKLKKQSMYSRIIDAYIALSRDNHRVALKKFSEILKNPLNTIESDYVNLGMAYCYMGISNLNEAKKCMKKIVGKSGGTESELKILKAHVCIIEKQPKKALDFYMKACEVQRTNIPVILDAAELALSLSNVDKISKLRNLIPTINKFALMFDYYLEALYQSVKGNTSAAREALSLSGYLQNRNVARILAFKLACEASDIPAIENLVRTLPPVLPNNLKDAFAYDIMCIMIKHKNDTATVEKLCATILEFRPETEYAQRVVMNFETRNKNYSRALVLSNDILKANPHDRMAYETHTVALDKLSKYMEGLNFVKAKANDGDSFSIVYAAKFAAKSERFSEAVKYMLMAAKLALPPDLCLEFGKFIIENGDGQQSASYISEIQKRGDNNEHAIANVLMAELSQKSRNSEAARKYYEETLKILPKYELPYIALALIDYINNDKLAARQELERGLEFIPDSSVLKLRLASLLVESKKSEDIKYASDLINSMPEDMKNSAFAQAVLSHVLSLCNKPNEAMQAAQKAYALAPTDPEILYQLSSRMLEQRLGQEALNFAMIAVKISKNQRIFELCDKALTMFSGNVLSPYLKKTYAEEVLKFNPESEIAKKIIQESVKEIENAR